MLRPLHGSQGGRCIPYLTVGQAVKDTRVGREADGDLGAPVPWPVSPSCLLQQRAAFYSSTLITLPSWWISAAQLSELSAFHLCYKET